jgi:hypothetical protein
MRLVSTDDAVRFAKSLAKDAGKSKQKNVTNKQHVAAVEDEEAEAEDSQDEGGCK